MLGAARRPLLQARVGGVATAWGCRRATSRGLVLTPLQDHPAAGGVGDECGRSTSDADVAAILAHTVETDVAPLLGLSPAAALSVLPPQSLKLQLITPECPLYHAPGDESPFAEDPFWGILWPGSFALCRYLVEHPEVVAGRRVLDFAAGCGVGAILAASQLGAASACANEIDPLAVAACAFNAAVLNGVGRPSPSPSTRRPSSSTAALPAAHSPSRAIVDVRPECKLTLCGDNLVGDVRGVAEHFDVVLAGDVCYEEGLAAEVTEWLRALTAEGVDVLVGDPGRQFLRQDAMERRATYPLPAFLGEQNWGMSEGVVWSMRR